MNNKIDVKPLLKELDKVVIALMDHELMNKLDDPKYILDLDEKGVYAMIMQGSTRLSIAGIQLKDALSELTAAGVVGLE